MIMMKSEIAKARRQKRCGKMMDKFLMLDKHERIPLDVTLHLLKCKKCRSQVRYLTKAEKFAAEPLKISLLRIKPVSMKKWIFCGILMIFLMATYQFSAAKLSGEIMNTIFYIFFGIVVTAYCAIFIAANLDYFVKKTGRTNCAKQIR